MKVSELKKKYKNQWVICRVLKEDRLNRVTEAKVLFHGKDKDKVYKNLLKIKKGDHIASFYTGRVPPKGMAFIFYVKALFST